ncbi:MAG: type II toxin-antitoxin system VapC family toxin [Phycisphaeraceae bacterium]|nr:type II toxin-antitoxin system VapC family toxin [Phycisphaeraceae bacterium]
MTRVFADACYWIALLHPKEELHAAAVAARDRLRHATLYTTEEVLSEVLNRCSNRGPHWRALGVGVVEGIRKDPRVVVDEQSKRTFDGGLALYKDRPDKEYSLVDCISFLAMKHHGITDALTSDKHFEQEGLIAMLKRV